MNETRYEKSIDEIAEILGDLVKSVVPHPEAVKVTTSVHGALAAFVIKTAQADVSRLIGSKGKHFKALSAIVESLAKRIGMESHLIVDEEAPTSERTTAKSSAFSARDPKEFSKLKDLLERILEPFIEDVNALQTIITNRGTTTIMEIKVNPFDHPAIYGQVTTFDYGSDGLLIGSIKNIFDGIGKNYGRIVRIAIS